MINIQPMIFQDERCNEVWKPLLHVGINPGEYLISNFGNIYDMINRKYVNQYTCNGYHHVTLRHNDKIKSGNLLVHRLVAENYVALRGTNQIQVNHIDGNKSNNNSYNLEWTTPKENTDHAFATGLAINNIGENSHLSKLTNEQVRKICELLSKGLSYKNILSEIGIENTDNNRDMIGNIYRGIAWKDISKDYKFPEIDQRFRSNSRERINLICKCIEQGMSNKEVYEYIHNKPFKLSKENKQDYELIRLIRNKKSFKDISCNYNF